MGNQGPGQSLPPVGPPGKLRSRRLETRTLFSTHVVTTTADSGFGSLRQAILDANTSPGVADTITFNISGSGVQTIVPLSPLPKIMDVLVLDGTLQPGYVGSPLVEINGASARAARPRGRFACTIKGLAINGFSNVGIHVGMARRGDPPGQLRRHRTPPA